MRRLFNNADLLLRNTSWSLAAEALSRVSRLVAIVALAAYLSPSEYGVACLALVTHELIRVFSRSGAGSKIIQCEESDLHHIAGNAIIFQWMMCITIAGLQIISAPYIAHFYDNKELAPLLQIMAATYLLYPAVAVKVFMLQRKNKFKQFGINSGISIFSDNISTAIFVLMGLGIASVAYAKIVGALVWFILFYFSSDTKIPLQFNKNTFFKIVKFSTNIFGIELLKLMRVHGDIFIAGKIFTPELFGIYGFAKNAGVGLGQSLSNAYLGGLFPYLCKCYRSGSEALANQKAFKYAAIIGTLFIIQSISAPIYIPLLFSEAWRGTETIVAILCLSACSAIIVDTGGIILRARDQVAKECKMLFIYILTTISIIVSLHPTTPIQMALIIVGSSFLWPIVFFSVHHKNISLNPSNKNYITT